MKKTKPVANNLLISLLSLTMLLLISGCADMGIMGGSSNKMAPSAAEAPQPYYSNEFRDLLIPNELSWNREKSMVIRTDSFAGGILHFSGNIDINSLADFFISSMPQNGWKMAGSAKYKNVLLAFVKPNKTCTISINDSEFGLKTDVFVYITEDISSDKDMAPSMGLGQEL